MLVLVGVLCVIYIFVDNKQYILLYMYILRVIVYPLYYINRFYKGKLAVLVMKKS